jgi:hypothetical protein
MGRKSVFILSPTRILVGDAGGALTSCGRPFKELFDTQRDKVQVPSLHSKVQT